MTYKSLIFLCAVATATAFVVPTKTMTSTATRTSPTLCAKQNKKDLQDQLDKYGPTPESMMGILFEKLESGDPGINQFIDKKGGEEWKELIDGMKKHNAKKEAEKKDDGEPKEETTS